MKKIKIIAGISWAILCLILIIVLFPGINSLSASVSRFSFMKINPNYSGGEISQKITKGNYTMEIRKPVFSGLIKERENGFLQVDWRGNMPDELNDTIDFDSDKRADFCVIINRGKSKTRLIAINSKVGNVIISTPTSYGWALRVALKK